MLDLSDSAVVVARGVSRAYRSAVETVRAVRKVDLRVDAGEFVCIVGASGSGKSTLLHLLAGLDVPDSGDVQTASLLVSQASVAERARLRLREVGVIFQDHQLIEEFTAAENVSLVLEAQGVRLAAARREAFRWLGQVGLTGLEGRFPAQLSGGQRQRVGVARALVGNRSVLLADEPTGALDSQTSAELFELLRALCRRHGIAVVMCSHDPASRLFADSVYQMSDGELARLAAVEVSA